MDIRDDRKWCFSEHTKNILLTLIFSLSTAMMHQNAFAEESETADFLGALATAISAQTEPEKLEKSKAALDAFKKNFKAVSDLANTSAAGAPKPKALLTKATDLVDELSEFQKLDLQFSDPSLKKETDALLRHNKIWQKKAARLLGSLCFTITNASRGDIDVAIDNRQAMSNEDCERELARLDNHLKTTVKLLRQDITNKQKQLLSGKLDAEELGKDIRESQQTIEKIKAAVAVLEVEKELFVTHADYPAFSINIYGGVESQTVNGIANPDIPRLGLMVYQQSRGKKTGSLHLYSNFLLTGSAEASQAEAGEDLADAEADRGLEANFSAFYAYGTFSLDHLYALWGPVASLGVLKSDGDTHTTKKRYIGIRGALNPETYSEILLGTTSGLNSHRLELRMQGPISRFDNGSRIFIGATFNLAYDKRIEDEPDAVSIYLTWHIPFDDVWNVRNGN